MPTYSDLISYVVGTTFPIINIYYLYSLERLGCQCSLTAKRTYILAFNIFIVGYSLFAIAMGGGNGVLSFFNKHPWLYMIFFLIVIATIVNLAFTIEFVNDMKRENCACSDSVFKDIMYVIAIIQAVTWSILGVVILVMGGMVGKDFAAGKITIKNIQMIKSAAANAINKAAKKS
jgi:hypothetical protein